MNFDFSDDQKSLKDQARKFLSEKAGVKVTRSVLDDANVSYDRTLWRGVADLGWLGAAIPEDYGGLGLGRLELCVLAEELGRAVAPIPFSSTVYFFAEALMLAGAEAQKQALLPNLAAGEVIGCFAVSEGPGAPSQSSIQVKFEGGTLNGVKIPVTDGDCASHAVVVAKEGAGLSLVLVDLNQSARDAHDLENPRSDARTRQARIQQRQGRAPWRSRTRLGACRGGARSRRCAARV